MPTRYVALIPLMVLMGICGSLAGSQADTDADEDVLRQVGLSADGPSLLMLFRKRTPDADSQARIQSLIEQLGSDSYSEREDASEELAGYGVAAVGLLRAATQKSDLEIRRRARDALAIIEKNDLSCDVLIAALRVLGHRKPARMTEVLLDYAPHAADAEMTEELCQVLASAALLDRRDAGPTRDGDPRLVQALNDKSPIKRAIAASALCVGGCHKQLPAVRRLLREPDPHVRRRVALALLEARDKAAVPVLIELLAELPPAEAEQVESMLSQVAGDAAPKGSLEAARDKYRDAWAEWWKQHESVIDLEKIELSLHWRGYTLAVCMTAFRGRGARFGSILELDAHGRTRWQIKGLSYPVDAQVIDERRVLVTEYRVGLVTERNHNGDFLRRIPVPELPLEARRLSNGNTLVTTGSRVFEMDRHDKEVWTTNGNRFDTIAAACAFRGGEIGICYRSGEFVRVDRKGKTLASFRIRGSIRPNGTHIQALPNGHILVPLFYNGKVVELDENGREVWSVSYNQPMSAQRLPNGRTLVAGYGNSFFVELDKNGREVKSQRCDAPLMCVSGR
jgi:HEAT repeat protein